MFCLLYQKKIFNLKKGFVKLAKKNFHRMFGDYIFYAQIFIKIPVLKQHELQFLCGGFLLKNFSARKKLLQS